MKSRSRREAEPRREPARQPQSSLQADAVLPPRRPPFSCSYAPSQSQCDTSHCPQVSGRHGTARSCEEGPRTGGHRVRMELKVGNSRSRAALLRTFPSLLTSLGLRALT